ncbi:MAG: M57 family metalloprotease [Lewinella sp.]
MKFTHLFIALCGLFILSSCTEDSALSDTTAPVAELSKFIQDEGENGHTNAPDLGLETPIEAHVDGHSMNFSDVEKVTETRPDGTVETLYRIGGDVDVTREQLDELRAMDQNLEKQYRTNNLVSNNQTITVIGYTGGSYALTTKMRTGLSWAIANYNALNIGLTFSLSFQASTNADIVVYRNFNNNGAGGSAGFPSGGNPYKWVQIYAGMNNYNNNVNEHVVGHEIGHCLGLRHTDWFSRQSCGQSGESAGSTGAVHIPGTPTGYDANSLMLACFGSNEDGEFGFYDRVALEYLY